MVLLLENAEAAVVQASVEMAVLQWVQVVVAAHLPKSVAMVFEEVRVLTSDP